MRFIPQTLRLYEREGLLKPSRTEGNTRLYTDEDLERLEFILNLARDLGVNIAGIAIILQMRERMEEMNRQMQSFVEYVRTEMLTRFHPAAPEPPAPLCPCASRRSRGRWWLREPTTAGGGSRDRPQSAIGTGDPHSRSAHLCSAHRIRRHADPFRLRLWRSACSCPFACVPHAGAGRHAAGGAALHHRRGHHRHPGLEADPFSQRRMADCRVGCLGFLWASGCSRAATARGQVRTGRRDPAVFCVFPVAAQAAGICIAISLVLAAGLRPGCRRARRRLWDQRPASGHLRVHAPLVATALSRHAAGLFSACQPAGHDRLRDQRLCGPLQSPAIIFSRLPVAIPAVFLGRFINHRLSSAAFLKYVYTGLAVMRVRCCWSGP